jgi:hypothetical protein
VQTSITVIGMFLLFRWRISRKQVHDHIINMILSLFIVDVEAFYVKLYVESKIFR